MRVQILFAILLPVTLSGQQDVSGTRIDFTGEWELVEATDPPSATSASLTLSPLGDRGAIRHTEDTLAIAPDGTARPHDAEVSYRFDAPETEYVRPDARGEPVTRVARLRWVSAALTIVTTTTMAGRTSGWDDLVTLSINSQQQLEVIRVTPNLWPRGTTSTHRWTYRRRPGV